MFLDSRVGAMIDEELRSIHMTIGRCPMQLSTRPRPGVLGRRHSR